MRKLISLLLLLYNSHLIGQEIPYNLVYNNTEYIELSNPIFLCQDSIGTHHYFKLNNPIKILNDDVDSIFIMNWSNLHIGLGNSNKKEFDLFVPINSALRKKRNNSDSIGFSISYQISGEIGNRILVIQWKEVKPTETTSQNESFNVQLIINEEDESVSYHYGKMPLYVYTSLSLFFQGRTLAIYFIDDFKSFSSSKNEIYYVGQNWENDSIIEIEKFKLLNSTFSDESHSVYMHYDHTGADLQSGYLFTFSVLEPLQNEEIFPVVYRTYPNPASTELYIISNESIKTQYEIFDINGVLEQRGSIENNTINIEQLSPGLHLLKLSTAYGEVQIEKFIKL